MPDLLIRQTLNHVSGVPEDASVVNWSLFASDAEGARLAEIKDALADFWSTDTAFDIVGQYIGATISRSAGAHLTQIYDVTDHLDGSPHGAPIDEGPWTLIPAASGTTQLPSECAAVITFHALGRALAPVEVGLTRPKQRHTGRVYIGPLQGICTAVDANEVRFTQAFTDTLAAATERLINRLFSVELPRNQALAVWSREDAIMRAVAGGYIDNAVDIQRRRGVEPTRRSTFNPILL